MMRKISLSIMTAMALSSSTLLASDLKPILQLGYDFGGTTLAKITTNGYYGYETTEISAGQGLILEAGATVVTDNKDLELQFLVGYKFDQETASNGSAIWDTIPFTTLGMFKKDKWKFGGGLTYHLNPKFTGDFSGVDNNGNAFNDNGRFEYENSIGSVVQVQYQFSESIAIGARGTFIDYKLKNSSTTHNGNTFGINFAYTFGEESEFR